MTDEELIEYLAVKAHLEMWHLWHSLTDYLVEGK